MGAQPSQWRSMPVASSSNTVILSSINAARIIRTTFNVLFICLNYYIFLTTRLFLQHRVHSQASHRLDARLAGDALAMGVHRIDSNIQSCGYLFAAQALCHQFEDILLALGELIVFLRHKQQLLDFGMLLKVAAGLLAGFAVSAVLAWRGRSATVPRVGDLCAHSRCGCKERHGILVPALIHSAEIFVFILVVSGAVELALHFFGEDALESFVLNKPVVGELLGGLIGLVPNCAVSVSAAQMYLKGGMSAGALMASSLAGSGVGLAVLFRTNRNWRENFAVLGAVYVLGVVLGHVAGRLL